MSAADGNVGPPTRRDYLTYGGAAIGGSLLAGYMGEPGSNPSPTDSSSSTPTTTPTTSDRGYSVTMAPVGEVRFESIPERWIAYDGGYADMGVALGRAGGMTGIGDDHLVLERARTIRDDEESNAPVERSNWQGSE